MAKSAYINNMAMENPAFKDIEAVKQDRFVVLEYVEATPGPRNINAIGRLADAFHRRNM